MIPLRDVIPSRTAPIVTVSFIAINAFAFVFELSLPEVPRQAFITSFGVVPADFTWLTVLTSMFLHGGWLHFLGNMLYLWIFGDNVEDRMGHGRYFVFYLLCGTVAAIAQVLVDPESAIPTIGASGAIAGVMGAYFVLYPHSRILTLIPIFVFLEVVEVPAVFFLGFWFIMQLLSGAGSIAMRVQSGTGGIAFWAHVAGFAAGAVGVFGFKQKDRKYWQS
ncbi:MAG: rhomboid family intramembrane serine protease [Acidobacteria bacterium]|nr:rhomboid family intramembrane serine protease [Acidobacteriota bacterium]MBI3261858.1 rhomboid family intramembrane serine protease [Acidobacteriota bacterium]